MKSPLTLPQIVIWCLALGVAIYLVTSFLRSIGY